METIELHLGPRTVTGKQVRHLRNQGITPVHVYGRSIAPVAAQVESRTLLQVLAAAGHNTPIQLTGLPQLQGHTLALVREIQRNPRNDHIVHVDLLQIEATQRVQGSVPIVLVGEAPAVRRLSGVMSLALHALTLEGLPLEMPRELRVDVSHLEDFEMAIRVKDVLLPDGVRLLTDPEEMVARVNPPRKEEEVAAVAVAAVAEEAEAAPAEEGEEEGAAG